MIALGVPSRSTPKAWPLIERWVRNAFKRVKADHTPEQVREMLANARMQLWLAWDGKRGHGCCITEIIESAQGRTCNLVLVGGLQFRRWQKLIGAIKDWARVQGCTRLECSGRAGWERQLKTDGWVKIRTTLEMEL